MLTMKTSPHTDTHHALARNGEHAVCRRNLKPWAWMNGDLKTAVYAQSGDTFKRSCSQTRVTCLACQRKLATELAVAEEQAHLWNAALLRMASSVAVSFPALTSQSVAVAVALTSAGLLERVSGTTVRYRLTVLGRRAAGIKVHELTSRIQGQEYTASGVDAVQAAELTPGDMVLVDLGHTVDFSRVIELGKSWVPAHVEWRGVRCNRPRQVLEVTVVGAPEPLTYRLDDKVTVAR